MGSREPGHAIRGRALPCLGSRRAHRLTGRGSPYPDSDKTDFSGVRHGMVGPSSSPVSSRLSGRSRSAGPRASPRLTPSVVFLLGLVLSMGGLAYAMRTLPLGTSYAVWVGVGASLTVAFGMATGEESISVVKVLLLLGLVGCVVGLKLAH